MWKWVKEHSVWFSIKSSEGNHVIFNRWYYRVVIHVFGIKYTLAVSHRNFSQARWWQLFNPQIRVHWYRSWFNGRKPMGPAWMWRKRAEMYERAFYDLYYEIQRHRRTRPWGTENDPSDDEFRNTAMEGEMWKQHYEETLHKIGFKVFTDLWHKGQREVKDPEYDKWER